MGEAYNCVVSICLKTCVPSAVATEMLSLTNRIARQTLRTLSKTLIISTQTRNSSQVLCKFEHGGQVAVLTLNAPSKLNALSEDMGDELTDHVTALKENSAIRCCVVTGAGKAFSAGGDLQFLMDRHNDTPANNIAVMEAFYKRFLCLRQLPVPVIGAINGPAVGAGFCLALGGCDIRVASTKAKMGLTFAKLGLHPGMAATHFLPLIAGPQVAADMLLTGRLISAAEGLSMGLVARVSEDAVADAMSIAANVITSGPVSVRTCVETLRRKQEEGLDAAFRSEATAQSICYPTADLAEGVTAVKEKRTPVFTGK